MAARSALTTYARDFVEQFGPKAMPYDKGRTCAKCGGARGWEHYNGQRSVIEVTCGNCGARWDEIPKDAA